VTTKRRKWLLVLAGAGLAASLIAWLTREREPMYQGWTLSQWITPEKGHNPGDALRAEAREAVRHIGTNAFPHLIRWLGYEGPPSRVRPILITALRKLPETLLPDSVDQWMHMAPEDRRAMCACAAFNALGDEARTAIPQLTQLMNNAQARDGSVRAVFALAAIGTNALPVLVAQLANTNAINRTAVASALGGAAHLRADTNAVMPLLIHTLQDKDPNVAFFAAVSLSRIARTPDFAPCLFLPAEPNCFRAEVPMPLRARYIFLLGCCGAAARPYLPDLLAATSDPSVTIRECATNALRRIAPASLTNAPPP
jgi:hypothetical protein